MALIKCKECQTEISSTVTTCPNCGYTEKNWKGRLILLFGLPTAFLIGSLTNSIVGGALVGLVVVVAVYSKEFTKNK